MNFAENLLKFCHNRMNSYKLFYSQSIIQIFNQVKYFWEMSYPLSLLLFVLAFCAIYFFYLVPKRKIHQFCEKARKLGYRVKEIPFNPFNFFLLNYIKQDGTSFRIFKQELKQYDIIVGNLFFKMSIVPSHPDILKDIFANTNKIQKNPTFINLQKQIFGEGLVIAEGQEWKKRRRIISELLHFDFINQMYPLIEKQTDQEMKNIDQKIKNHQNVDLLKSFIKIFANVIMKCFFEVDIDKHTVQGKPFHQFFLETLDLTAEYVQSAEQILFGMVPYKFGLSKRARQISKNIKICDQIAIQIVDKQLEKLRKGQFTEKNLLTLLYQNGMFNEGSSQNSNKYKKEELIGQFFVFLTAGTDTSANTINLLFHYLSENKQFIEKINQEIQLNEHIKGPQKLKKMKWTDALISQTLRIGGPASFFFPRIFMQNVSAGGIQIPKGTTLDIIPVINDFKDEYFENPFDFKPQRWIEGKNAALFTYLPFSAGQRNCIGQYLAKMQIKIVIQKIVKRYNFEAISPIKMQFKFIYKTFDSHYKMSIKEPEKNEK